MCFYSYFLFSSDVFLYFISGANYPGLFFNCCSFIKELGGNIWSKIPNIVENTVSSIFDFIANYLRPERRLERNVAAGEIINADVFRVPQAELMLDAVGARLTTEAEHRRRLFRMLDQISAQAPRTRIPRKPGRP